MAGAALQEFDPGRIVLVTGTANPELAQAIGKELGVLVGQSVTRFKDGEIFVQHEPNLRNRHVFVINPSSPTINPDGTAVEGAPDTHLMETLLMLDAARRGSAHEITAVVPYYGYARQDRKSSPRTPISASLVANLLQTAGADRIVTVDLHAAQTAGSVQMPWDDLPPDYVFVPKIRELGLRDLIVLSPDEGGSKKTAGSAEILEAEVASVFKRRDLNLKDASETYGINGNVDGHDVYIPDDIASTLGTLTHAVTEAYNHGARRIIGAVTHGIFNGDALAALDDSPIERLFTTDSIRPREQVLRARKIEVVTIAPMLARVIRDIETGQSLSEDIIHAHNNVRR